MEHRNEIINESSSKDIFFQNRLAEYKQPHIYSLEEEFAKTKKNRDLQPYLIFFGFIFLLVVATVGTAKYLEDKSKQINIDISDFEDLRLIETLSAAKEKEEELNQKTEELDSKTKELTRKTKELNQLNSSFKTKVQKIREKVQEEADLKNADKKALKKLEEKENKQLDVLKKEYEKQFAKKQAEINRLLEQVTKFNSYQYGLNTFLKGQKATGCVIDTRQRNNILLHFSKNPKLSAETVVKLYRAKDEYIGTLKLTPAETGLQVEIVEVANKQSIKPLDWFSLP